MPLLSPFTIFAHHEGRFLHAVLCRGGIFAYILVSAMSLLAYIFRFVRYLLRALAVVLVTAGILFYLPPVQSWLGAKVCDIVESSTGIPIELRKLRIVFPLNLRLEGVTVGDSSLRMEHLTLKVGLDRLLAGELSADEFTLGGVQMKTGSLIEGVELDGTVARLSVRAKRWDMVSHTLLVNDLQLDEADVQLSLRDTSETPPDTSSTSFLNRITLLKGGLHHVRFSLRMPDGGMRMFTDVDTLLVRNAAIGLQEKRYRAREIELAAPALFFAMKNEAEQGERADSLSLSLRRSRLVAHDVEIGLEKELYCLNGLRFESGEMAYHANQKSPAEGFDPEHLSLLGVRLETDRVCMEKETYLARIVQFTGRERSGLYINKVSGEAAYREGEGLTADLFVQTPNSRFDLRGKLRSYLWDGKGMDGNSELSYNIRVGYRDMRLLSSLLLDMPGSNFPARDLQISGRVAGKGRILNLLKTEALLPGVFRMSAKGTYDFAKEAVSADLSTEGNNLNRLVPWIMGQPSGTAVQEGLHFPPDLRLQAAVHGKGNRYQLAAEVADSIGKVSLNAAYDARNTSYEATLSLDSVWVNNYYPVDSVTDITADFHLRGRGTDIYSARTQMEADFSLKRIGFRNGQLRFIRSQATLAKHQLHVDLEADNLLLNMEAQLDAKLYRSKPLVADLALDIWDADLKAVGLVEKVPEDFPFGISLTARLEEEMTSFVLQTGDLSFFFDGKGHFSTLQTQVTKLVSLLQTQLEARNPEQSKLKEHFPEAQLLIRGGEHNIINYILKERTSLSAGKLNLMMKTSPETGISGTGYCYALQAEEEFTLDTLLIRVEQDSLGIGLFTTFINGPENPAYSFQAQLNTLLSDHEGKVRIYMRDSDGDVGVNLGLYGRMQENGYHVSLYPYEPVVAFRKMQLNHDNEIWIRQDGRVFADVRMQEMGGGNSAISILSNDTVQAEQDLSLSVANIDVADVVRSFPFLPDIGGILDATVSIRKKDRLRFLVDSRLQRGTFNDMELGDLALRGGYMPDSLFDTHSVAAQLTRNGERMVSVGAKFKSESSELLSSLITVHGIPLELFNGFVPAYDTYFSGTLAGKLRASGMLEKPVLNGELHFDSSRVVVPAANLSLTLDTQKIYVRDNVLHFKEYDIYASGKEPFRIEGTVSATDFTAMPVANLTLKADNYQLINRRQRDKGTLLLGKLIVGLNTTLKGPLDRLQMRGNMRILGSTDLTYIMENSPLTVEDQLNEQLTFVDFSDTLSVASSESDSLAAIAAYRPSSLDMLLQLTIDPTVHMRVELTKDGESYVDLEGGDNLTLQATPLSDLSLNGRYSLNNGTMKYAFSMIPLKEFSLQPGSYVAWNGNLMNPTLHLTAVETIRSTVTDEDNQSRGVNFEISINLTNTLENLGVSFDISAPQDAAMQEELNALTVEERSKQAITTLAMGTYSGSSSGGLKVNDALNSLLQSQINSLAGNVLKSTDLSIGMSSYSNDGTAEGGQSTEYTYKFARRFWNNRIRVVIGGTITQGANTASRSESFIDNISIEYNIDEAGTKSVRIYYNKNYESILEGEIIKTGVGFVYRKKLNTLRELLPWYKFRRKEKEETGNDGEQE